MAKVSSEEKVLSQLFPVKLRVLGLASDNDPTVLEFIKNTCNQCKYEVIIFTESPFALNLVRERKDCVDVILMEVHMPNMNGYEFLQHVSKEEINVPVIMMSLDHDKNSALKAVLLGACDYWFKPLNENQFKNMWMHVVRKALNENKIQNLEVDERRRKRGNDNSVSSSSVVRDHPTKRLPEFHGKFLKAFIKIALDEAVPERILEEMNVPGLTRENVASHLQKCRHIVKSKSDEVTQTQEQKERSLPDIDDNTTRKEINFMNIPDEDLRIIPRNDS